MTEKHFIIQIIDKGVELIFFDLNCRMVTLKGVSFDKEPASFFIAINNERKGVENDSEHREIKGSIKG